MGVIPALGIAVAGREGVEQLQSKDRWALPGTNPCFLCFCGHRFQRVRGSWGKESFPLPPKWKMGISSHLQRVCCLRCCSARPDKIKYTAG